MPEYTLICPEKHQHNQFLSFSAYDELVDGTCQRPCPTCGVDSRPIAVNPTTFYGAWRISDSDFRDAEEASAVKINSTKDIDRLEKNGTMYRITNPSQYRLSRTHRSH